MSDRIWPRRRAVVLCGFNLAMAGVWVWVWATSAGDPRPWWYWLGGMVLFVLIAAGQLYIDLAEQRKLRLFEIQHEAIIAMIDAAQAEVDRRIDAAQAEVDRRGADAQQEPE